MNCCAACGKCSEGVSKPTTNYDYIKNASLNSLAELLTDFAIDVMSKPEWYKHNLGLADNTLMKEWLKSELFEKVGQIGI